MLGSFDFMIEDGCSGSSGCTGGAVSKNDWNGATAGTITVPIGILDVTDVQTVLNNTFGTAGANDTNVIFTFGSTANATTGLTVVTVNLTNASNNAAAHTGQIGTWTDLVLLLAVLPAMHLPYVGLSDSSTPTDKLHRSGLRRSCYRYHW